MAKNLSHAVADSDANCKPHWDCRAALSRVLHRTAPHKHARDKSPVVIVQNSTFGCFRPRRSPAILDGNPAKKRKRKLSANSRHG
jgi:hypothetical protein